MIPDQFSSAVLLATIPKQGFAQCSIPVQWSEYLQIFTVPVTTRNRFLLSTGLMPRQVLKKVYEIEKALNTAKISMNRRKVELTDAYEAMFREAFNLKDETPKL